MDGVKPNSKLFHQLPLKNSIPLAIFSDYMNPIHYTKTDQHVSWCSFKGEHRHANHIIHMTHALPFGSCSRGHICIC